MRDMNLMIAACNLVFERSVVLARLTGKPEKLRCGEDFIWESLLSQGKSARQHKGSKSQPVRLVFFMFLFYDYCLTFNDYISMMKIRAYQKGAITGDS